MQADGVGAPSYSLAGHVFACRDAGHVVLLDLKQDRYFSIEEATVRGLGAFVGRWPGLPVSGSEPACAGNRIMERLLESGMLAQGHSISWGNASVPRARSGLSEEYPDGASCNVGHVAAFLWATAVAAGTLRRGLEKAVYRVRDRNLRARGAAAAPDPGHIGALVAAFTRLTPFLFTARDACLFESLALIEYLARYSLFPTWVFGIRARPFAAHCWVQADDVILNDTVEHAGRYQPIMAV